MSRTRFIEFGRSFGGVVREFERFAVFSRGKELQEETIARIDEFLAEIEANKLAAIADGDEDDSNGFLSCEMASRALQAELRMLIALKEDDMDRAWTQLILAQNAISKAIKAHDAAVDMFNYSKKLDLYEQLLFPPMTFFSTGMTIEEADCSICERPYDECNHIKGRPYMGQFCCRMIKKATPLEVSFVTDPADKLCRALSFTIDGVTRDTMTYRVIVDANSEQGVPPQSATRSDSDSEGDDNHHPESGARPR